MKKYLALVLGVLFILSFTATAFAVHETGVPAIARGDTQIILSGKILVRGWYFDNVNASWNPVKTESQALYSTNANIMIDANVSDNVRGFMELETGTSPNSGLYYWGVGAVSDTKANADLLFRQLWIQHTGSGLLGVPTGIKVGHMMITLGEKQFLCNERFGNDAILLWVDPTKELHLMLGTTKLQEGTTTFGNIVHRDDLDGYVLVGTYMPNPDTTVGLNYTLVHSDRDNDDSLNFQNLGLHANGKAAGLSLAAEVDIQFGKSSHEVGDDEKYRGWAVFAKVGYVVDPVTLRASLAMGSGDSDTSDIKIKEFQTLQGPDAVGPTARLVHYTQIYERTVRTTAQQQDLTGNTRTTGIANTTYYNLGMDVKPMSDLSASLDGFIIRATKNSEGSKNAGWEIDGKVSYKLAKNLTYFVEAGYFKAGKYYEEMPVPIDDRKSVTQAVHGLLLTF